MLLPVGKPMVEMRMKMHVKTIELIEVPSLRGSTRTPHAALIPCASGGCDNAPRTNVLKITRVLKITLVEFFVQIILVDQTLSYVS